MSQFSIAYIYEKDFKDKIKMFFENVLLRRVTNNSSA